MAARFGITRVVPLLFPLVKAQEGKVAELYQHSSSATPLGICFFEERLGRSKWERIVVWYRCLSWATFYQTSQTIELDIRTVLTVFVASFVNSITTSHGPPYLHRAGMWICSPSKVWAFIRVASWKGLNTMDRIQNLTQISLSQMGSLESANCHVFQNAGVGFFKLHMWVGHLLIY